jgi:hypothetical protein
LHYLQCDYCHQIYVTLWPYKICGFPDYVL